MRQAIETTGEAPSRAGVERLLRPRSVAIVGVSPNPAALGSNVLRNLERAGFAGTIHLINPKYAEIGGRPCVSAIDRLPDGVDCAVLAIPRDAVLDIVESCGRKGIGGVIIFSAGFAETGESGRRDQARLGELARLYDMVIEGPNCIGMVNHIDGVSLTFVEVAPQPDEMEPRVAIVSQSGAMASVLSVDLRERGIGLSFSVSTGNEAASGVEDYLESMVDDAQTTVIAMIVEHFRQPQRFLAAARRARALGKRIILLHPGRSAAARASAETHTGAMTGDHAVMRTMVAQTGTLLVDRLETLLDVTELVARGPSLPSGGAMVLADSGAFKAMTLDLCEAVDLPLPEVAEATATALRRVMPDFIPPSNPLDLTAQGLVDPDFYNRVLDVVVRDDGYGSIVLALILSDPATCRHKFPPILASLKRLRPTKPVLVCALDEGAEVPPEFIAEVRALGVPFFAGAERALVALSIVSAAGSQGLPAAPPSVSLPSIPHPRALPLQKGVMPEYRSKHVLTALGIPVPAGELARNLDEAQAIAARLGFPVVLKAQSSALSHKSDAGGVILGLDTPAALTDGWQRLQGNIREARPGLVLDGVLVERMGRRGVELIVGARHDAQWGPVLLVGFGGVIAEALHDVRLLPPDVPHDAIVAHLHQLKTAALLRGYRGSPPLDVDAVADIVATVGAFMLANPTVTEVDINPLVVYPCGEGAIALDALICVG